MGKPYRVCPYCDAHLDHGERCTCIIPDEEWLTTEPLLDSKTYILGVDLSANKDLSMVQISEINGRLTEIVNTLVGLDAEDFCVKFLNNKGE